jgi:hypothetical protein
MGQNQADTPTTREKMLYPALNKIKGGAQRGTFLHFPLEPAQ